MTLLTHLFLDFENVKPSPADIAQVRGDHIRLWVVRGPHQNKFDATLAEAWQPLGDRVQFVRSFKAGKNAVDFHVAFCLGRAHRNDELQGQKALYIIVSRDKDFDVLFGYLGSLGSPLHRANTIPEALKLAASLGGQSAAKLPAAAREKKPATPKPKPAPRAAPPPKATPAPKPIPAPKPGPVIKDTDRVIARVRDEKRRPTTRKKLEHHVTSVLGNKVDQARVIKVIDDLTRQGVLAFEGTKVRYDLSKAKK
jgi:uncharacterized protein (DUF2267 family)